MDDGETLAASKSLESIKEHLKSPSSSSIERSPLAKLAAKLLYKRLKIQVLDGRILQGDFVCIDKQGNLVLHQTVEVIDKDGSTEEKFLGQVLVPAKQRVSCDVLVVDSERKSIQELVSI